MGRIAVDNLYNAVFTMLLNWNVPDKQAEIVTDTIVYAHVHEKHTHGITRLPIYKKKMNEGNMPCETCLTVEVDLPALSVLRCNNGFGQVAAYDGVNICIEKARKTGIATVLISDSNNFGVTGYFGELIADQEMIGIITTASGPAIAPLGGEKSIFGTNPICCAYPAKRGNIVLDMAISEAARGKVRLAQKNNEKIPFGWAVDKNGNPTDDPTKALEGNMLAIGGVKGFGLAMTSDILAGLLSGSAFGGAIKPLAASDGPSRHGHMITVIDIKQIMPLDDYYTKIEQLIKNVKNCGKHGQIWMPGEHSLEKAKSNRKYVVLNDKQIEDYNQLAEENGILQRLTIVSEE